MVKPPYVKFFSAVHTKDKVAEQQESTRTPHPSGRPTKYTPDMIDRLEGYMRNCQDDLPSKAGFAIFVGVHVNTMDNWGRKYPEFLWALERLHTLQHAELLDKGLAGEYNSTICKLLLINNHGYGKRRDTTSRDTPIEPKVVSFRYALEQAKECVH